MLGIDSTQGLTGTREANTVLLSYAPNPLFFGFEEIFPFKGFRTCCLIVLQGSLVPKYEQLLF